MLLRLNRAPQARKCCKGDYTNSIFLIDKAAIKLFMPSDFRWHLILLSGYFLYSIAEEITAAFDASKTSIFEKSSSIFEVLDFLICSLMEFKFSLSNIAVIPVLSSNFSKSLTFVAKLHFL